MPPIRRALISVSDKSGLVEVARALAGSGVEIVSTGGTAKILLAAGIKLTDVSSVTGIPEMMDGRVKTLHPKIHGGLLALRGNPAHEQALQDHAIAPFDLLIVNLYPFEETVARGARWDMAIENIDVGGPAMIRAAAKNWASVTVIVDPEDYSLLLGEIAANGGATFAETRKKLAAKAFGRTAVYDAAISQWFASELADAAPAFAAFGGKLIQALRYGENPHQTAAFYRTGEDRAGVASARQLQGKELSYNNINDTDAAFECVAEFDAARIPVAPNLTSVNPVRRGAVRLCTCICPSRRTAGARSPVRSASSSSAC